MNRITEEILVRVLAALGESPNAKMQRECLVLLGERIPRGFDEIWRTCLPERGSNLDRSVSRGMGEVHRKEWPASPERPGVDGRSGDAPIKLLNH